MMQGVVRNLSQAMTMVKDLYVSCQDAWADEYRHIGRTATAQFLRDRMEHSIADHLASLPEGVSDRRNGSYTRHLLTELGDLILRVPRTRRFNPLSVIEASAGRNKAVDRLVLSRNTGIGA